MTFIDEEEAFRAVQEHLLKCDLPLSSCPLCSKVYSGERRPEALIRARFREGRPQVAAEEGTARG